jgi:hypothetical protein
MRICIIRFIFNRCVWPRNYNFLENYEIGSIIKAPFCWDFFISPIKATRVMSAFQLKSVHLVESALCFFACVIRRAPLSPLK